MAAAKRSQPSRLRVAWDKITHGWSWMDTAFGGVVFGSAMYLVGRSNYFDLSLAETLKFNYVWFTLILKLFGAGFFSTRAWAAARYPIPSSSKVNWEKLSFGQMMGTILRDKPIMVMFIIMALAFTFSAAPEGLSIFQSNPPAE